MQVSLRAILIAAIASGTTQPLWAQNHHQPPKVERRPARHGEPVRDKWANGQHKDKFRAAVEGTVTEKKHEPDKGRPVTKADKWDKQKETERTKEFKRVSQPARPENKPHDGTGKNGGHTDGGQKGGGGTSAPPAGPKGTGPKPSGPAPHL